MSLLGLAFRGLAPDRARVAVDRASAPREVRIGTIGSALSTSAVRRSSAGNIVIARSCSAKVISMLELGSTHYTPVAPPSIADSPRAHFSLKSAGQGANRMPRLYRQGGTNSLRKLSQLGRIGWMMEVTELSSD